MQKHLCQLTSLLPFVPGMATAQDNRPNVIIIYTDDHGTLDANCYGAEDLYTPNIDSLAAHGVKFNRFYGAPVSSASRACLLTGQFEKRAGVTGNAGWTGIPVGKETMADRMRANGYQTACIGKWHLGSWNEYRPTQRGFDYFWGFLGGCIDSYSHYYYWWGPNIHDLYRNNTEIWQSGKFFAEGMLDEARDYINNRDKDKPFLLYWAVNIPHYPLQPKQKWIEYYSTLPNPRRMYAAFLSTFDEYLGEFRNFLHAQGLDKNTIIIFQADNGHSTEVRGMGGGGWCGDYRGGKFSLFEGGIRVPCIVSWPGHFPEGETRDQVAMCTDWLPTLAELCHFSVNDMEIDGHSIVSVINNAKQPTPHDVLHFDFTDQEWAVMQGDWKLICNAIDVKPNDKNETIEGLFLSNLALDPTEKTNYKEQYPKKVKELEALRETFVASIPNEKKPQ